MTITMAICRLNVVANVGGLPCAVPLRQETQQRHHGESQPLKQHPREGEPHAKHPERLAATHRAVHTRTFWRQAPTRPSAHARGRDRARDPVCRRLGGAGQVGTTANAGAIREQPRGLDGDLTDGENKDPHLRFRWWGPYSPAKGYVARGGVEPPTLRSSVVDKCPAQWA